MNNYILVIFTIIITLSITEITFQLIDKPKYQPIQTGWRCTKCDTTNQLGYRGQKIEYTDEEYIVLLLGDSQLETPFCDFSNFPETVLEQILNSKREKKVKVFTIASSGYGNDQQLLALREYFTSYRADLVLLLQTPENDVWNNTWPTHWPKNGTYKPTFTLDKELLIYPQHKIGDTINRNSKFKIPLLVSRVYHTLVNPDKTWDQKLPLPYEPKSIKTLTNKDSIRYVIKNKSELPEEENLTNEKTHLVLGLTPTSERLSYGMNLTNKLISEISTLSESRSADFAIIHIQATESKVSTIYVENGLFWKFSKHEFDQNSRIINRNFRTIYFEIDWDNWKVSQTDTHINCTSMRKVFEIFSDKLFID